MGWMNVLHDGASVPACAVPVGGAFERITAHFEVRPIGVKHTLALVRGDGNRAMVDEGRSVGGVNGVDKGRGPHTRSVNSGANAALEGRPAKVGFIAPGQLDVGRSVVLSKRNVERF